MREKEMTQLDNGRAKTAVSMASSCTSSGGECVKVAVRCRPLSKMELAQGHTGIVRVDATRGCIEVQNSNEPKQPAKSFFYDAVYGEDSRQLDVYDETVRAIVDSVLQGFNGTVFAYGQTGTGKTHTMEGVKGSAADRGVIPNAIDHIFQHIAHSPPGQQYLVRASFLEIYQEHIRDLLNKNTQQRLELKERPDLGVYVKELSSFVTKSVEEIEHVLSVGHSNRSVGRTNMNEHSSRSHAIFIVTVECSEQGLDGQTHIRVGRLNLVDLAGSERQSKTGSEGERFREATKINLSLSALGNVISALSDRNSAHIPYRDSKLTRLLQDSLGGNSKTAMIATIGPASYNLEETMSTLRYSSRAKQIENKPKINEDPKDALLREFQDEIARLKAMLEQRAANGGQQQRQRRKTDAESGTQQMDDSVERDAEEYAREQQRRLGVERERLLRNGQIIEEERRRILTELAEREKELEQERQDQLAVAAKIRAMQSKLLSGDGNLLDRTRQQEELLRQRRAELADQRRREREMAQRLEAQELEAAEIRQTFVSLQQEVEAKRRKLQKLHSKVQTMRLDMQDAEGASVTERHGLEQTVLEMNKELALKWLIIDNFVPREVAERVRGLAQFDETEQRWALSRPDTSASCANGCGIERLNLALSPNPMADSGLGSSNGGSQGGETDEDRQQSRLAQPTEVLKRPCSTPGQGRPTSAWELSCLVKLRHRLARQRPAEPKRLRALPELSIPEEVLRFCPQNLVTFHCAFPFVSEVQQSTEQRTTQERLVLDTSRIPVSTHRRAHSRPGSASSSRRGSLARSAVVQHQRQSETELEQQQSKNVRARSVFSGTERTKAQQMATSAELPLSGDCATTSRTEDGGQHRRRNPCRRTVPEGTRSGRRRQRLLRRRQMDRAEQFLIKLENNRRNQEPQFAAMCCSGSSVAINWHSASQFLADLSPRPRSRIPVLVGGSERRPALRVLVSQCTSVVPYFQQQGDRMTISREQLSSPEEEEFLSPWRCSTWSPALGAAHSTLQKVRGGTAKRPNFHTPPALLQPIMQTSSHWSSSAVSHCCLCSSGSCWLASKPETDRTEPQRCTQGTLRNGIRKKKAASTRRGRPVWLPDVLTQLSGSTNAQRRPNAALVDWAVLFAAFALLAHFAGQLLTTLLE